MKKHLIASLTIGACLLLPSAGVVFAGPLGTDTGQPGSGSDAVLGGVHCGTASTGGVLSPGNSTAPANNASAFNGSATNVGPNGQPVGGNLFASSTNNPSSGALSQPGAQSMAAKNGSQYDIACFNSSQLK